MQQTPCSPVDRHLLLKEVDGLVMGCLDRSGSARLDLSVVEAALGDVRRGIMSRVAQAAVDEAMSQPLSLYCPQCGRLLAYHDTQGKQITLAEGPATLWRGRYRCSSCQKEYVPVDVGNDLEKTGFTLGAQHEVVADAVGDTYRETSEEVRPEIQVSHQRVGHMVKEAAGWRKEEEAAAIKATLGDMGKPGGMPTGEAPALASTWREKDLLAKPEGEAGKAKGRRRSPHRRARPASPAQAAGSEKKPAPVCVASVDGGRFRTTETDAAGQVVWREARTATFSVAQEGKQLPPKKAGGKLYLARCLEAAKMFPVMAAAYLLLPESVRMLQLVFIADGGPWWDLVATYFPNAVQILDIHHAAETLAKAAGLAFPSDRAKVWEAHVGEWLQEQGRLAKLLTELEQALPFIADVEERHKVELAIAYARTHEERMRYWEFLALGYPIGSGGVESAVDQVIQERLRGAGMRWRYEQADNMVCLRAAALSGELAGIFRRRAEACRRRLDPYLEPVQLAA